MTSRSEVRELVLMGLLVAIGVSAANVVAVPVAGAKAFPVQHAINVVAGVLLGPVHGVTIAFVIGLLRNMLGTGTILAFPGGMVGALLSGYAYRIFRKPWAASVGEVVGTGVFGAILSYPLAKFVLGKPVAALAYVIPFSVSSALGAALGIAVLLPIRAASTWRASNIGTSSSRNGGDGL